MLTLNREQGQSIYFGNNLSVSDLDGTYDYRIDVDVVDHRVGHRRIEVAICDRFDIQRHVITPAQPDLDFGPGKNIRLALLNTHEYWNAEADQSRAVARLGVRAPSCVKIVRDNANAVMAANRGAL